LRKTATILHLLIIASIILPAQSQQFNFRHLTPNEGLSNNVVNGIAQDQYGFIWLGTNYGLNRFDGIRVKKYFNKVGDSTSLNNDFIRSLFGDSKGRIWVGSDPGFCLYDHKKDAFISFKNALLNIDAINEDKTGNIWVGTNRGLRRVDIDKRSLEDINVPDTSLNKLLHRSIRDLAFDSVGNFVMATGSGILIANIKTCQWSLIQKNDTETSLLRSNNVQSLAIDKYNRIWASVAFSFSQVYCISADRRSATEYEYFHQKENQQIPNSIRKVMIDKQNRVWVGSTFFGLSLYREEKNDFISFLHDPAIPNSFSADHCTQIFQDRSGFIWLGTQSNGADYFHPDQGLFSGLQRNPSLPLSLLDNWSRSMAEDAEGNLWLATAQGVSVYNFQKGVIKNFTTTDTIKKKLHSSSVRSLLYDKEHTIWIATAQGLNRYHPTTAKMDFFDSKDSLPKTFTWFVVQLKNGKILTGNNQGLFEYIPSTKIFYSYSKHPVLKDLNTGLRSFKEDSKGRWWIGTFSEGVIIYDPIKQVVIKHLVADSTGLLSNDYTQSFCEDENGSMWIGTRMKLVCFDLENNTSKIFGTDEGLPDNWICGMRIDKENRLWVGTTKGLCVMNKERKVIRVFGLTDGLPSTQFNEQDAYETRNGLFVFPSHRGFIFFDPEKFNWEAKQPPVFITGIKVSNKVFSDSANTEELKELKLKYDQNFFSFEFSGLHFSNPRQCWYAYKLDGFDKDWIYTQENMIHYTNVPGGNYTFRYKTSVDPSSWDAEEKIMSIRIGTVFYKATWFWILTGLLSAAFLYGYYRTRIRQQKQLYTLENKAQLLEKEKALVMYESLKQQLNPHFLFNSLTSLSSLIRHDQEMAGNFLDRMSKVYRYILKNRDNETVPLSEELKFVQMYIDLQKTRFTDALFVSINIDEEYYHRKIVPVTLQNLVENAIKHNTADINSPLTIELFVEDDHLVVRNNLQKKNFVETSNKQGLANMESLYRYLDDRPMEIKEDPHFFTVKIPLI